MERRSEGVRFGSYACVAHNYLQSSLWKTKPPVVRFSSLSPFSSRSYSRRICSNSSGGCGQRDPRIGLRGIPADIHLGNLAPKAMGSADGLGIRGLRTHQSPPSRLPEGGSLLFSAWSTSPSRSAFMEFCDSVDAAQKPADVNDTAFE